MWRLVLCAHIAVLRLVHLARGWCWPWCKYDVWERVSPDGSFLHARFRCPRCGRVMED